MQVQSNNANSFWQYDQLYWFQKLNSSAQGLSKEAADTKFLQSSHTRKKRSAFTRDVLLFLSQFRSPLMLMLIGAVILSAFLGDTSDVFIILFIILAAGILSFVQERNAGRVVEKLQSMIALKCDVLRDDVPLEILSTRVVPGDIIILNAGDMVPADCLILEANELNVNEASLTGESFPVRKEIGVLPESTALAKRTNCLWQGTSILNGSGKALVIFAGEETIFGHITQSTQTRNETTFEKGIKDFGFFLMKITLVLSIFILTVNILNHKSVIESALFALALAVGMAPELLPAITTIAMSAGARRLVSKKVIVKRLASIQNLGEINLLCTDKTGTITEGVINVSGLVDPAGKENEFVKKIACWNAIYETGYSNPIDEALKNLKVETNENPQKKGEVPYDFIRKRLSISVSTTSGKMIITKGAFEQIISICTQMRSGDGQIADISSQQSQIGKQFEQFGLDGTRAIGVCYKNSASEAITKDDETGMIFAGFALLEDKIKAGITETINELRKLQVGLKIITGDNVNVSRSIALHVGVENPVILSGRQVTETSAEALIKLAKDTHIFAEVEPQQKERIILALRKSFTVAYMGDGINDVSAMNAADVGISVENAVDVAREAADFVLMEKNLNVLVDGIREGRKTFANTLKYIYISTGSTFGNMCSVAAASLILPFLPMLPKQILLTNFLTDFPYLTVASDNVDEEQLETPGRWNLKLIRSYMLIFGIHSSLFDIITFVTLLFILKVKESAFQTGWFIESILSELCILFIIRTHKNFFKSKPARYLVILSVMGLMVTLGLPYLPFADTIGLVPLPMVNLGAMLLIVAAYIMTADLLKVWFFRRNRNA